MITIQATHKKFWDNAVEGYIFFMTENLESASDLATLDKINKEYYPNVKEVLRKHLFSGKKGQHFVLTATTRGVPGNNLIQFIFIGLGALIGQPHVERENLRRGICSAIHILKRHNLASAIIGLPNLKPFDVPAAELVKQMAIAAIMSDYEFSTFKTDKRDKRWAGKLYLEIDVKAPKTLIKALEEGIIIGQATSLARNWADLPGNILTPTELANGAHEVAKKNKLKYTVFERTKALELGMGGFCAVDAGSEQDGKFVVLEYTTTAKNAPTIALIGKGVCFDSGGLSLKPENRMTDMKFDMSGAAAVIATMDVIAKLKPNVNVIGLTPLVENMPSGKAQRQDDIITFMNGKTAEIRSTDAEGRLILADALCYAEKFYKPDVMIDIATLTGACMQSLGHFYAGLMTRDSKLAETLHQLGLLTGDKVWLLPMDDDFKEAIKSDVADMANTGAGAIYGGGTVTASHFLENFVSNTRWAHIDMAGVADHVPGFNYLGRGATGAGVRLLTEFVIEFKR